MDPISTLINHYEGQCLSSGSPGATNALLAPYVESLRNETGNLDQTEPADPDQTDSIMERCEMDIDAMKSLFTSYLDRRKAYYAGIAKQIQGLDDFLNREPINLRELMNLYMMGTLRSCDWWIDDTTKAIIALLYMLKIEGTALIEAMQNISFSNIGCLVLSILLKFINIDLSLLTQAFFIISSPAKCITGLLVNCIDQILRTGDYFIGEGKSFTLPDGTQVPTNAAGKTHQGIQDMEEVIKGIRTGMYELDRTVTGSIENAGRKVNSLIEEWDAIKGQMEKMREKSIKALADIERIHRLYRFVQVLAGGTGEDDPPQESFDMPKSVRERLGDTANGTTQTQTIS